MPYELHFNGRELFRGKKKIKSKKIKEVLRNDKTKCKNGKDRSVYTALAVVKTLSGVQGPCPFFGKSEYVKTGFVTIQRFLSSQASTALKDGMEDLLIRSRSAHSKRWAEYCHAFFTEIAAIIVQSSKPSVVAVVIKSDLRLNKVKFLLHRFSIYATGFPEATWQDSLYFAVGTGQAKKLIENAVPAELELSQKVEAFFCAGIMFIVTGLDAAFFVQASVLCEARKKQMTRIVGTHEELIERLFTQISNRDDNNQKCISHLSDALRKRDEELQKHSEIIRERDAQIEKLQQRITTLEEPSTEGASLSNSLNDDSKHEDIEEGEIVSDNCSDITLTNLPPIPDVKNLRFPSAPAPSGFSYKNYQQSKYHNGPKNNYGGRPQNLHQHYRNVRQFHEHQVPQQQPQDHPQFIPNYLAYNYTPTPQTGFVGYPASQNTNINPYIGTGNYRSSHGNDSSRYGHGNHRPIYGGPYQPY